jgi:uncharacterized membrane protein
VVRLGQVREAVRSGFWAVPSLCVAIAIVLALVLVRVDRALQDSQLSDLTFGAGPDGARETLSAITSSMITFTGLVFSITIVVLTLTSSQFSPRVLRTFLRDRVTQFSLGVYTATFTYSVLVLRTVRGGSPDGSEPFVPAIATTVAIGLLLLSVAMFVAYINHIARSIQVSSIIGNIGVETRGLIDRRVPAGVLPDGPVARPSPPVVLEVPAPRGGVLTIVDTARLVRTARAAGVLVLTELRLGQYVPEGSVLCSVVGEPGDVDVPALTGAFTLGKERTMQQDIAFGFRQLVDIAEKALSPGINDPTTAVQALDQIHELLRRLAVRHLPDGAYRDADGQLRLLAPSASMEEYLALALDEIAQYGADALQVQDKLRRLLVDVSSVARPEHRAAVDARLAQLQG